MCFLPFLIIENPIENVTHIIHRMFPFARGLYEDKVANFWCISNVFYKWYEISPQFPCFQVLKNTSGRNAHHETATLVRFCSFGTLISLLPVAFFNIVYRQCRSRHAFLLSSTLSSLAFFLFSYHVHEVRMIEILFRNLATKGFFRKVYCFL